MHAANLIPMLVRDTSGTALYFMEYDGMRHLLGRDRSGEQGATPPWLPIHSSLVPFVCGSFAGVSRSPFIDVNSDLRALAR